MASGSGLQYASSNNSPHQCKECGFFYNSAESLEVHVQYHKENLLNKWATQAGSHAEETNNNNTTTTKLPTIKREFISNSSNSTVSAAADSSGEHALLKKTPDYAAAGGRSTPETNTALGHPPTPQSFTSGSSPYQNATDNSYSPGFQNYHSIKTERASPNTHFQHPQQYSAYPENQFFGMDSSGQQSGYSQQDYYKLTNHNHHSTNSFRYHPYQNSQSQVSSSSPAYPPQPTPSPSPKQCDKCGYVCDSAPQLIEHLNVAHPSTPAGYQQHNQHFLFETAKAGDSNNSQSEILDLDSHKVHQVFPEDERRQNGDMSHNPHSVSAMLGGSWPQPPPGAQGQRMYFSSDQQNNGGMMTDFISTTTPAQHEVSQGYRPFEHMQAQSTTSTPVITSTQVPSNPQGGQVKAANWKSNEARRPKTYNCTACNKWFTSSGHLKRHYNTTLHKNAVKSSGQPDPATMPISAHHHPGREPSSLRSEGPLPSPPISAEDSRSEDASSGMMQQGPYDGRQQGGQMHPMAGGHHQHQHSLTNLSGGSPPNGEAGPSVPANLDTRGLLSLPTNPSSPFTTPGYSTMPMIAAMDSSQFQMYPNGSAPHVTQATMVTNNLNITGEPMICGAQPLPSFAQIQGHRFGIQLMGDYENADVGGQGPATAPFTNITNTFYSPEPFANDGDYKVTLLTVSEIKDELPYSPPNHNNNLPNEHAHNQNLLSTDGVIFTDHRLLKIKQEPMDNMEIKAEAEEYFNNGSIFQAQQLKQMDTNAEVLKTKAAPAIKVNKKKGYEEGIGSPQITSTVQQPKIPGVHKCYDCDKTFNKACYLTQHNKTFHCGDKPFKCPRCGKRFSGDTQYQEHLTKHAGDKPYKCDQCPKQFNHKTDLRRHMCLHSGSKPYACETCGKGFIRKDHMLKHCETHTKKSQMNKAR